MLIVLVAFKLVIPSIKTQIDRNTYNEYLLASKLDFEKINQQRILTTH